ncbi:MAG: hypothetical protein BRC58_05420 [Cyanobacteria bacterium QS_8_64_29]|nr:MAG: hypothetical protein BRC58_05420 [Cyanobacteria bacterium QS_8_64_29]
MQTSQLPVSGMRCSGCESRLSQVLTQLEGVFRVEADHQSGQVRIVFDETRASPATIRTAIAQAGYEVAA